jgi:indole-3-glycerol phosphate synthase
LTAVRAQTDLPVLRKDFVIDSYQLYESRVMGADCVLLIVSALQPKRLAELYHLARSLQMDVLIEVHDETELALALGFDDAIVGINNRNLHTFETSLETTYRLLDHIPPQSLVVTESGIRTRGDIAAMRARNVHTFLIGEAFMRSPDPGAELAELVSG